MKKTLEIPLLALRVGVCCGGLFLASCATSIDGERETMGEALKRMDKSLNNTLDRLQNKTYDIY